jgi:replicative DNA helicase
MKSHEDRILLETVIISELLSNTNAFISICEILSPVNFSNKKYRKIYQACTELYPNTGITVMSVNHKSGIPILALVDFFDTRIFSQNLKYDAFVLLQDSIQEQYISLCKRTMRENNDPSKNIDLTDFYNDSISETFDIFKDIYVVLVYLNDNKQYEKEHEEFLKFYNNIILRATKIGEGLKTESLFRNLDNLYHFDHQKKAVLKALSDATRYVMANPVSTDLEMKILTLLNK